MPLKRHIPLTVGDNKMEKEFKIAALIFIGFIFFLWLEKPLRELRSFFQIDELTATTKINDREMFMKGIDY